METLTLCTQDLPRTHLAHDRLGSVVFIIIITTITIVMITVINTIKLFIINNNNKNLITIVSYLCVLTAEDTQNVIAALPPQQVIYFQASVDNQNLTLDASTGNNYTITFPLPLPAQAFWSLTLYNATSLNLIVHPINRYNINDRVSLSEKM